MISIVTAGEPDAASSSSKSSSSRRARDRARRRDRDRGSRSSGHSARTVAAPVIARQNRSQLIISVLRFAGERLRRRLAPATDQRALRRSLEEFFRAVQRARGRASQAQGDGPVAVAVPRDAAARRRPPGREGAGDGRGRRRRRPRRACSTALDARRPRRAARPDEHDRRCVSVSLTADGRRALARKQREVDDARARIAASLEPDERAQAAVLLDRLAAGRSRSEL